MLVHLDTDIGSDPDDVCALALLLGSPGVELSGITTVDDRDGWRAAYAEHCLALVGRSGVPVAAGAAASLTTGDVAHPVVGDPRYWPLGIAPTPPVAGAAIDLLAASVDRGATVVAIGPYTNLALLERQRPGTIAGARVVVMGGWTAPPPAGLPPWGPERDYNVQHDPVAALELARSAPYLTLATFPAGMQVHLRAADVPRLRAAGPLGWLLAAQAEAYRADRRGDLGREWPGLPDDLLNFHYDPLACAAALGWPSVQVSEQRLRPVLEAGVLHWHADPAAPAVRTVTGVDSPRFSQVWLDAVEAASR